MMESPGKNMDEYKELQYIYLEEAENMFGSKIAYNYGGLSYREGSPRVILSRHHRPEKVYIIEIHGKTINNRKEGIFQLSHEVVHLLSPVEEDKGNVVNYLEEGMATFFSRMITVRETNDEAFCDKAIEAKSEYLKAYKLYLELISIDEHAVRKLRHFCPVILDIQPEHFKMAGLNADDNLIEMLLMIFKAE